MQQKATMSVSSFISESVESCEADIISAISNNNYVESKDDKPYV